MNDKIADMLIRIKNASDAGNASVPVPYSGLKLNIAHVLLKEGYLSSVTKRNKKKAGKILELGIAYDEGGKPKINGVKRVSKLSCRVYCGYRDIRRVRNGYGRLILSTPKGIMTGDAARKEQVGGEALFKIW